MSDNNQINFSLNFDTKSSEAELNKLSSVLNNIPVVGNKASASLQRLSRGLSNITKLNPALLGVGAGIAGIGGAALLAYQNSEKLRNEIDKLKTTTLAPVNRVFQGLGDSIASVVRQINEANEKIQILNGHGLDSLKQNIAGVRDEFASMQDSLKASITLFENLGGEEGELKLLGISASQQRLREEESKKNIEIYEKELKDKNELKRKYERELSIQLGKVEKAKKSGNQYADGTTEQERQQYKLNQMQALYQAVLKDIETLEEQKALAIREGVNAIEQQNKIQEEIKKKTTQTTTKTKEEKDLLEQLREKLAQIKQYAQYQNDLNNEDLDNEKERKQYLERRLNSLNQQKSVVEQIYNEERKRGIENEETKKTYEAIKKEMEAIKKEMEDTDEVTRTWKDNLQAATQIIASAHSTIGSLISSAGTFGEKSLASYTKAINEAQAKLAEFQKFKKEQEEEDAESSDLEYEAYLEKLDKEYEIAKKVGDKMTMLAIENKKKELAKDKEKLEKEKELAKQEEELERQVAIAEYNKSYAEWQNEVASAKTAKAQAITDAIMMPVVAAGNAALGMSRSFVELGPIAGPIMGAMVAASVISAAVSGAANIKSASVAYDNVNASPPTPPAFKFGTTGYKLESGQSAIVGETGAEVIRNMAGKLVVESNAQAKAMGRFNEAGMYIEQVIFNVSSIVDKKTIYKAMNEYKQRDSFAYTR